MEKPLLVVDFAVFSSPLEGKGSGTSTGDRFHPHVRRKATICCLVRSYTYRCCRYLLRAARLRLRLTLPGNTEENGRRPAKYYLVQVLLLSRTIIFRVCFVSGPEKIGYLLYFSYAHLRASGCNSAEIASCASSVRPSLAAFFPQYVTGMACCSWN